MGLQKKTLTTHSRLKSSTKPRWTPLKSAEAQSWMRRVVRWRKTEASFPPADIHSQGQADQTHPGGRGGNGLQRRAHGPASDGMVEFASTGPPPSPSAPPATRNPFTTPEQQLDAIHKLAVPQVPHAVAKPEFIPPFQGGPAFLELEATKHENHDGTVSFAGTDTLTSYTFHHHAASKGELPQAAHETAVNFLGSKNIEVKAPEAPALVSMGSKEKAMTQEQVDVAMMLHMEHISFMQLEEKGFFSAVAKVGKKIFNGVKKAVKFVKEKVLGIKKKKKKPEKKEKPITGKDIEDCCACQMVWRQVEIDVGDAPYLEDVQQSFEQNCMQAQKATIFYQVCDDMYSDITALTDDYMSGKYDVKQMCERAKICRTKKKKKK